MSNFQIAILLGVVGWIGLCAVLALFFKGAKRGADQQLEDMEQIAAVSKPAPLEHPHVMAGTAWGRKL